MLKIRNPFIRRLITVTYAYTKHTPLWVCIATAQ